jgi:hypothetical protein
MCYVGEEQFSILPAGVEVKKWGISWAAKQKNEMCSNCKTHFNHH